MLMDEEFVSGVARPVSNSISEQRSMLLVSEGHGDQILKVLRTFRDKGMLFDFHIQVQGEILPCHRCVLAACSDFFKAMFEVNMIECDGGLVTLSNLSPEAVRSFLDFAYLGQMEIMEENVDMLFHLSSFLQVSALSQACSEFLIQTLDLFNCLHLLAIAEGYGSSRLLHYASEFVMANFHALSSSPDFLEMPAGILRHCLASDSLSVPDEESALRSLILWTQHDQQNRRSLFPELLTHIRLHHLPPAKLEEMGQSEALILDNDDCSRAVMKALAEVTDFSGLFTDARPSTISSYIYVHKTEENGEKRHTFCYNVSARQWHQLPNSGLADLPGSSITSIGEKLFVIGGCHGKCCRMVRLHIAEPEHEAVREAWCYSPVTGKFVEIQPMQCPRTMHVSVSALHHIYVIGGKSLGMHGLLDVECYDPLGNTWKSVSPLPHRIYFPETAVCGTIIYTLGSELETSDAFNPTLDCFFRYDAEANEWCQLLPELGQLFHATLVKAVSIKTTLYLCDLSTYKVYSFCPDTCVWKIEASFECAGFNAGAIGVQEKIYILGGDYSPDEITDEVQVYDIRQSEWQEVVPMPRALTEFHCQVISFNHYRDPWRVEPAEIQ
ncbi:kelch repeat and BTB domain-containing protein 3 isoform X1 [Tachysurus vachellii]|uniref:kelch repeat and BTB domain-containing protein 3 isoform X1 n=1 Tax=Tachysurus vachellii TaxID=175792 RepID=UPI00296B5525|nr:kelch repeat and BTB domain-containing protein 3 isoform X1 [Tachysurus vachellii]XP_060744320.1 kelch repeat and BTB domain-containing protein 3 isoform X1 [Tachysurus vachellii]